jgi:thioredoxin 1
MSANQVLVWVIAAVIVLGGGYLLFSGQTAPDGDSMEKDEMIKEGGSMETGPDMEGDVMKGGDAMMDQSTGDSMVEKAGEVMSAGSYESYAPEKLARADSGDVVLFFRASWCPTCKALDSDIRAKLSKIPASLTILDIDYDNSTSLKQKYGVTYQHTFVQVRSDGSLVKKWSGSPTLAALVSQIQ